MAGIHVTSEIKKLKKVMLHRPGREFLSLSPDTLERLSYDDMPLMEGAAREHDAFAKLLRENGVEVVYLEDLVTEALDADENAREEFIVQYVEEAGLKSERDKELVLEFMRNIEDTKELVLRTMEGIYTRNLNISNEELSNSLVGLTEGKNRMVVDAIVCPLFTRDCFACIGESVSLNKMYNFTRSRETIYGEYIFKYHPEYKNVPKCYDRYNPAHIEGGDILILNEKVLAVGLSLRTEAEAIEQLARNLFADSSNQFETVLAFKIPVSWAFMHLDTVFTQVDYDKFTVHPKIMGPLQVFEVKAGEKKGELKIREVSDTLEHILAQYLELDKVELLPCAGGDPIAAGREQFYDGTNTFCIEPGVVVVYDRNQVTNKYLRSKGLKVLEIECGELSRGRGGPRCMTMPLLRED